MKKGEHIGTLDVGGARVVGGWGRHREYGQLTYVAGVNSEGRDFINWHGSPW
jgi:hypothetical protein